MWKSINGPLQDLWLTRAGGVRPVVGHPYTLAGVLQGTRIKATKGGVCIERTSEIMWKSINGPLQDLWLTRAGGVRPVGTPQFRRLYPRPPTKWLPARKTPQDRASMKALTTFMSLTGTQALPIRRLRPLHRLASP